MTDDDEPADSEGFRWTTEWPEAPHPALWLVALDLRLIRGRLEAVGLHVTPRALQRLRGAPTPLTSTDLRLPLARLIQRARQEHMQLLRTASVMPTWPIEAEADEDPQALVSAPGGRRRRRPEYDQNHYKTVARIYLEALATTSRPTLAVQHDLQISYSLAAKFVAEARRRGLLPPTTRGRMSQPEDAPKPVPPLSPGEPD